MVQQLVEILRQENVLLCMVPYLKPSSSKKLVAKCANRYFASKWHKTKPFGKDFNYEELKKLDIDALKKDDMHALTDESRVVACWLGTLRRINDSSYLARWIIPYLRWSWRRWDWKSKICSIKLWPDNASLDKARRLLWPIKKNTEIS
jgi:catalase (peroxidase I)